MEHPTQFISRNLPVGWRFNPTDVELLLYYLKPKLLGDPIYGTDIIEFNICNRNPHDLFGDPNGDCVDEVRYAFSPREFNRNNQRKRKVKDGGSWKSTGDPRSIMLGDTQMGSKRSVTYSNNGVTEITSTEFSFTAPLNRPIVGDYVIYKLERKPKNIKPACKKSAEVAPDCEVAKPKKRARNFKVEVEPDCKKAGPKKKRTEANLTNCLSASALMSGFQDKNPKDLIANPAIGEGEQSNHMACGLDNQCPVMMTTMPTYDEGGSSYPQNSNFDNYQNLYGTDSALAFNKGAAITVMNSHNENWNSDRTISVSTYKSSETENVAPDKMTDMPSYVENQSSCGKATFSSPNKDEKSCPLDYDFLMQYLNNALDISMDIPASVAGNWSTQPMPADFEKQNQNEKTGMSFPEDDGRLSSTSEVYNNKLKEYQIDNKKIDLSIGKDCSFPLMPPNSRGTRIEDVKSQCSNTCEPDLGDDFGLLEKDFNLSEVDLDMLAGLFSEPQQLTLANEIPQFHGETNMATPEGNHSQVTACDAGQSATGILDEGNGSVGDEQWVEEMLAFRELYAGLNSTQQPDNTRENAKLSSFGSLSS